VHHFSKRYAADAGVQVNNSPDNGARRFREVAAIVNAGARPTAP
jgi:hypothetical protein